MASCGCCAPWRVLVSPVTPPPPPDPRHSIRPAAHLAAELGTWPMLALRRRISMTAVHHLAMVTLNVFASRATTLLAGIAHFFNK